MFIDKKTLLYLSEFQKPLSGELGKVYNDAVGQGVPVIPLETANLLSLLVCISKPQNILEIGCAVGFSAMLMAKHMSSDGHVETIERNPVMIDKAKENIKNLGYSDRITLLDGDAIDILSKLEGKYDLIFMDGAKGQYIRFLPHCIRLLNDGGILIADNVLQRGAVALPIEVIPRRQRTIHKRLGQFLSAISESSDLISSIVPVGDGLAICYKKNNADKNI